MPIPTIVPHLAGAILALPPVPYAADLPAPMAHSHGYAIRAMAYLSDGPSDAEDMAELAAGLAECYAAAIRAA